MFNPTALSNNGQTLIELKKYDKAIEILLKGVNKDLLNPKNYFRLSKCYK